MLKAFEDCIKRGGKVRAKKLSNGRYQKICIFKGKVYPGKIYIKKGKK